MSMHGLVQLSGLLFWRGVVGSLARSLAVAAAILLVFASRGAAQTTLLTESFENGGTIPAGWSVEAIAGPNIIAFLTSSSHPSGWAPPDGSYMVAFTSFDRGSVINRLRRTTAISTVGFTGVTVDFKWLEDASWPASNDTVELEYSTDLSTWNSMGTIPRYNATEGWKTKTVSLPAAAQGRATLYIAFKFTTGNGTNYTHLDLVHVTATPSVPVPTLGQYGGVLLALMLLGVGIVALRRTRMAAGRPA
jgi:hypothetical protein